MGPELQYTGEKPADPLTLYIFEGKDGKFTLYEDEGTTYGYEKGAFATLEFTWDNAGRKLSVGKLQGDFPGLVRERTIDGKADHQGRYRRDRFPGCSGKNPGIHGRSG